MQNSFSFLDSLDLTKDVKGRLSTILKQIVEGSPSPLQSPIVKRLGAKKILSRWDGIFNAKREVITEDLYFIEQSNRAKYGPRSVSIPWSERIRGLRESFTGEKITKSIANAIEVPSKHALRPITYNKSVDLLKRNTNSGLPFFIKKGIVIDMLNGDIAKLLLRCDPCILFTRTQEQMKTRDVWGYPISDIIKEMRFYSPLLSYQRKLTWRSALTGPEQIDIKITKMFEILEQNENYKLLSLDFSLYDSTVKTTLQKYAFNYIKGLFQKQYSEEIQELAERFNTIPIITPDGIWSGPHGVPSGSAFTNEVDSIVQYLCATSTGLSPENFDIQGDDGAYVVSDPDLLKETFKSQGLIVNDDKSYISKTSLVYLQNLYSKDYVRDGMVRGIYPTYRALNRILFPERFTDYKGLDIDGTDFSSIRTISILENCKYHPLFPELVKFIHSLDKTGLTYTPEGLTKYLSYIRQSSGTEGIFDYRYEDRVRGINSFETVKILSELNRGSPV